MPKNTWRINDWKHLKLDEGSKLKYSVSLTNKNKTKLKFCLNTLNSNTKKQKTKKKSCYHLDKSDTLPVGEKNKLKIMSFSSKIQK